MTARCLSGGCHCGALRLRLDTARELSKIVPRACDCSYCRQHGAAWMSDPAGALTIAARTQQSWGEYRQGSEQARFVLCRDCGVLVAVVFDDAGRLFAAVNATCLDAVAECGPAETASPQRLGPAEKLDRWRQLWIADVRLTTQG
jgi:hypothetical protein